MKIPGYVIKDPIGKGGMATAYLALQESLGREVVLKVLDTRNVQNADMVERFLAEGRIVASLNHPNIITIFDIGISGEELYISMEYVQGGDLKQRIKEGLSAEQTLDYLAQLASGLKAAHSRDIVHRDIKPANILFREDGTPLITDFGIAKQTTINSELTSTGMFLGSPNYVSPEQADGLDVDGRTDIYSLGCVLYEMLTGSKPFEFSSVIDIVIQHKQAAIPKLPEELSEFQSLLEKMMAKKPEDRFADAGSLLDAIRQLQERRQMRLEAAASSNDNQAGDRPASRRGFVIQILVILMILSAGFFGTVLYVDARLNRPDNKLPQASTETVLDDVQAAGAASDEADAGFTDSGPNSEEVIRALTWLGKQSLEEYKLTYPPKDNAYYYFNKLLEIDPSNETARAGISNIADRYAILAEQALARNETGKTATYVSLGLRIDPDNRTLLSLQSIIEQEQDSGLVDMFKGLFGQG